MIVRKAHALPLTHVKQVIDGSLSGGCVLGNEAEEGHHGKASILDLLEPPVSHRLGIAGSEAQRVKGTSGVA